MAGGDPGPAGGHHERRRAARSGHAARPGRGTARRRPGCRRWGSCGRSGCGPRRGRSARRRPGSAPARGRRAAPRVPSRGTSASRSIVRDQASRSVSLPGGYEGTTSGHRSAGREPGGDPAVEDADARVAEVVEHPPQASGDRAAGVVVGHDVARVVERRGPRGVRRRRPGRGADGARARRDRRGRGRRRRRSRRAGGRPRSRGVPCPDRRATSARRRCAATGRRGARGGRRRRSAGCRASPGSLRHGRAEPCYPVARRRDGAPDDRPRPGRPSLRRSSVVERVTVNHLVVGSNPTAGASSSARKSPSRRTRRGVRFEAYPTSHPTQVPDALRSVWEQYAYRPREKRDAAVPLLSRPPRPGPRATSFQAPRSRRRSDRRRCKPR